MNRAVADAAVVLSKVEPAGDGYYYVPEQAFMVIASFTKTWHGAFARLDAGRMQKLDAVQFGWLKERCEFAVAHAVAEILEASL